MKKAHLSSIFKWLVPGLQGPQPLAESAVRCTRCNACAQSCPAYLKRREESFSPRGRVQFIRLLAEKKIKPQDCQPLIADLTRTCLLCARCTAACAGKIPVAHFMLALRRAVAAPKLPGMLHGLLHAYGRSPRLFRLAAGAAQAARRIGLVFLLKYSGILLLPPLRWIRQADRILPRKTGNLKRTLSKQSFNINPPQPDYIYLPSPEAQYVDETIGLNCLKILKKSYIQVLLDTPCGFFESVYGSRALGLRQARKLLIHWEKIAAKRPVPLITDSIELFSFLKHYPLLFAKCDGWRRRAEKLAAHVHFIAQYIKPLKTKNQQIALDISSVLYPPGEAAENIYKHLGKNLLECEYSRFPLPAAAEAFIPGKAAEETVLENVKDIARHQVQCIYCLSVWSALELEAFLRRHYPAVKALHIVHLQVEP